MKFTKMQGAGNDFIILDLIEEDIPLSALPAISKRLCARRLSIGADGLMAVARAEDGGDFRMHFYNSDGSRGEMCGNGARCIARYGCEHGHAGETQRIETDSGLVVGRRVDTRMYTVRLSDPTAVALDMTLSLDGRDYPCSYIELGTPGLPHAVVPFDELDAVAEDELRALGRGLRWHPAFPKGANINFYKKVGENDLLIKTFERGVEDFTMACGTGSGSTVTALTLRGEVSGKNVRLTMPGGQLFITLTADGGSVRDIYLTGPTDIVAEGVVRDEDLVY